MQFIKKKSESIFESFYRSISFFLVTKIISKTDIKPNHITYIRVIILITGFISFTSFNFYNYLYGFLTLVIWDLLDCVDGDLASYKNMKSKFGEFIEEVFDFSIGKLAGPLAFCVVISYLNTYPQNFLFAILTLTFLVFSDRFFHLSIDLKNRIFKENNKKKSNFEKTTKKYKLAKYLHTTFLYYELQIASLLLLLVSLLNMSQLLPFILLFFALMYFILGVGIFFVMSQKNE